MALFDIPNPFVYNPAFDQPENNFIEKGISNGIEKGLGNVGDKIIHAGEVKLESAMVNLPELASLALICYLIYLGYKMFIVHDTKLDISKIYPIVMVYIIFKLVWRVIFHI